ncbi:bifunctional hydroxymethylpyrimidine kinase/phosphomethylpyrimidine kinase [Leuconostoc kimchii]|uniref:pyridoxal kinase n=2 Tax=Leuconostoc kimchii TaxID=136609 RepID=D5T0E6_LEUKI|nr:bifunctional hydroxymethylpyrimidine kinase/phosphomethylpyrimidine kinase [Leuconostoc kimchii]ADG39745.1 phosphomethylpyrimidine kinase [Leuconostoc kimchii IMSNU 11154]QBR47462.1 bifunctional hydroxymethylpyrimidine kinase/phosphomethylpyrimidine kinase [Leuconostoc kimchii]
MPHKILTIAGSDVIAGGGIQADLATFSNYGYFGLSVLTSIVTVSTSEFKLFPVDTEIIASQLQAVLEVEDILAIKVGLLPTPEIITLVANYLSRVDLPIIIDPVMVFKETSKIDTKNVATAIKNELLPLATIVTPNLNEAQILSDQMINSLQEMKQAAKTIFECGAKNVVIKGGTALIGNQAVDILYDGVSFKVLTQEKITTAPLYHNGAGCTLSASIAANLGRSSNIIAAVEDAKEFVWQGIKNGVTINKKFAVGNVWQGARRSHYGTEI